MWSNKLICVLFCHHRYTSAARAILSEKNSQNSASNTTSVSRSVGFSRKRVLAWILHVRHECNRLLSAPIAVECFRNQCWSFHLIWIQPNYMISPYYRLVEQSDRIWNISGHNYKCTNDARTATRGKKSVAQKSSAQQFNCVNPWETRSRILLTFLHVLEHYKYTHTSKGERDENLRRRKSHLLASTRTSAVITAVCSTRFSVMGTCCGLNVKRVPNFIFYMEKKAFNSIGAIKFVYIFILLFSFIIRWTNLNYV